MGFKPVCSGWGPDLPDHCDRLYAAPGERVGGVGCGDARQSFIVRDARGADWGVWGYFTLPYAHVTVDNRANDFWTTGVVQ